MLIDVEPLLQLLTVEQKAAQMMLVQYPFTTVTSDWERFFRTNPVGGVFLDERNFQSAAQVRSLIEQLQDFARESNHGIPLMVAVAQEGGSSSSLSFARANHPGNLALGATRNSEYAYEAARLCANELRSFGFTLNLGPVVDIQASYASHAGIRSFGENEELVSQMTIKTVKGLQENGLGACALHFPGLGRTTADSYTQLTAVNAMESDLLNQDLKPFAQAFTARADAVMTSLALYQGLDREGYPAALSLKITTEILRGIMGFKGMVISGPLDARTILERIPAEEAASLAVRAGSDMLMSRGALDDALRMQAGIVSGLQRRYYEESRIDEAVLRTLRQKVRRGQEPFPFRDTPEPLMQKIARASITLVRNFDNALPLKLEAERWVGVFSPVSTQRDAVSLGDALQGRHAWVEEVFYDEAFSISWDEVVARFENCEVLVLVTHTPGMLSDLQVQAFNRLVGLGKPVILVATYSPYHLMHFPYMSTYLVTYGNSPYSMEALADVLVGEVSPQGRLPVALPQVAQYGEGVGYNV